MRRRLVFPAHPEYPRGLHDLPDPPAALHVEGELPQLAHAVTIVGTRYADADGLAFARELGAAVARAGGAVVSGGATGIDAAAHEGALEAGGRTLAVLAGGLDRPYPAAHARLFRRITEAGALLSEHDDDVHPAPGRFLARNRLVAALGRVVVVVQAPARSGALSTAALARRLGRTLLAVPHSPWDPRGYGCLGLLERGAAVCVRARDVLTVAALGEPEPPPGPRADVEKESSFVDLDPAGRAVLGSLGARPRHVDEIAVATGLPAAAVQRVLLTLMLRADVVERGEGRYARAHRPG